MFVAKQAQKTTRSAYKTSEFTTNKQRTPLTTLPSSKLFKNYQTSHNLLITRLQKVSNRIVAAAAATLSTRLTRTIHAGLIELHNTRS